MRHLALIIAAAGLAAACSKEPPAPGPPDLGADAAADASPDAAPDSVADAAQPDATPCKVGQPTDPLSVATDRGLIQGAQQGQVVRFLGVPFAAPPVGSLRFAPPAPPACWSGVKQTTAYADSCAQRNLSGKLQGSEDCLYLNIWTPHKALTDGVKRPVLFWIHGGGNSIGATNASIFGRNLYDGQHLADKRDMVVVSVSYRVSTLGFLAHAALSKESPQGSSGNYGVLDQIAGLKWVQRNVARFGGDPARVMVFGESAGAINTYTLVASPLAKGLFSAALMQSGFCVAIKLAERVTLSASLAAKVGCDKVADVPACLRGVKLADIVPIHTPGGNKDPLNEFREIRAGNIDGWLLKEHPLATIEKGAHNAVPLVVGSNADEHSVFLVSKVIPGCLAYATEVGKLFTQHKTKLLALYPCKPLEPKRALIDLYTDLVFTCHARRALRAAAKGQTKPIYRYYYTFAAGPLKLLGAHHGAEIPYVFGTYDRLLATLAEDTLSAALQGYWTRLAAKGEPNTGGVVSWGAYDAKRDNALRLDKTITEQEGIASARCDFWDTITPR